MSSHKRRGFRSRHPKNGFRRRNGSSNNQSHFQNGGIPNFGKKIQNITPFNLEKAIQKYQQMAKDAQSSGDLVLVQNYLQHADHYTRKLSEINSNRSSTENSDVVDKEIKNKEDVN